ncbi:hypothetical protein BPOR_0957g00050 [Botrytis porri]|uniref:Nephrocystin 3-like N-terminal domain-containing protein n=1 Tax=Botrytis porri TaxID=87229 RepID=A0A4Z1K929_9HELO|nr:hypothetical protein BPOR_0957g00050 [Botrytis porri]
MFVKALCDTRDIKKNAQRIGDHIRDLKNDARDIRHDISLHNQSTNTSHTNIVQHTRDVKDSMQDIKCTITQQILDFESSEKTKDRRNFSSGCRPQTRKQTTTWPEDALNLAPGHGFSKAMNTAVRRRAIILFFGFMVYQAAVKQFCDMTDYCVNNSDCFIAYYYFSFNETDKQNANNLLRSILMQLLVKYDTALDDAVAICKDTQSTVSQLATLKAMLKAVLAMPGTFCLILDAVDECPRGYEQVNRQVVCELPREVSSWAYRSSHLVMTSRKEADITEIIDEIPKLSTVLIRNENVNLDTRQHVKTQLENDTKLRKWSSEIKTEIAMTLGDSANGM